MPHGRRAPVSSPKAALLAFGLLCVVATPSRCQRPTAVVRVRVIDTAGRPIAAADVRSTRGVDVVAGGVTDSSGLFTFKVPRGGDEYQLVVRRIGYARGDHFFRPTQDTMPLLVRMRAAAQQLAPV